MSVKETTAAPVRDTVYAEMPQPGKITNISNMVLSSRYRWTKRQKLIAYLILHNAENIKNARFFEIGIQELAFGETTQGNLYTNLKLPPFCKC